MRKKNTKTKKKPKTKHNESENSETSEESETVIYEESSDEIDQMEVSDSGNEMEELCIEMEKYYAVYYDASWYIGRVLSVDESQKIFTIKFLKYDLNGYIWPRKDDIQRVQRDFIFYGPINMTGNGPFHIKYIERIKIDRLYKNIKKM